MKSLFKIMLDNYKVYVVAKNEREAINHCFKFLDFNTFRVQELNSVKSSYEFPYFSSEEITNES